MTLADSNVWLALALSKHEFHKAALAWFSSSPTPTAFCRATQQSFLRLLTTRAVLAPYGILPLTNQTAWQVYEGFQADKRIAWVEEPKELEATWKTLAQSATASPKLWMDAYLAAFALTSGHQLVTTDKAFTQFPGLDLVVLPNP